MLHDPSMIPFTQLHRDRRWPKRLIKQVLGDPDFVEPVPKCEGKFRRYYQRARVLDAERSEYIALAREHETRRVMEVRMRYASRVHRNPELEEAAAAIEISITHMPMPALQMAAIEFYYERNVQTGRPPAERIDQELLRRISMDFVLRRLVQYEPIFEALKGRATRDQAYVLVRDRISVKIRETYPDLFEE